MKAGLNVNSLAQELERRAESAEDYVADTRTMGFFVEAMPDEQEKPRVALTIDGVTEDDRGLGVNEHAQNQIAQRLGIPFRFFSRMRDDHPDILQETVGKLFVREPERRMIRTLDGTARAFLSDRYRRIDNYDVAARAVFPALAEGDQGYKMLSTGLTDTRLYLKLIWPDLGGDITDGGGRTRTVHPGICVSNSEVGAGAFSVEPFTFDSYCTNGCIFGLTYAEGWGMRRQHVGARIEEVDGRIFSDETMRKDDDALLAMAADMVRSASSQINFEAMLEHLRSLAEKKVKGDPVQAVEHLAKAVGLAEGEQSAVMAHLIEGGDLSRYGFWSAVTRTAEDVESYDRATELERVGGKIAAWSDREWNALAVAA
jgi:DNA-binding transcriptional ArsR family regulator